MAAVNVVEMAALAVAAFPAAAAVAAAIVASVTALVFVLAANCWC